MSAQILHPTEAAGYGPFLIDRTQLETIDAALAGEWTRMENARTEEIQAEVESEFSSARAEKYNKEIPDEVLRAGIRERLQQRSRYDSDRSFLLFLRDGRHAKVHDFVGALRDPALNDQFVSGFSVSMESGRRSCSVSLGQYGLQLKVEPRGDILMEQTFTVLKNWHSAMCPPIWLRIWTLLSPAALFLGLALIAFVSFGISNSELKNSKRIRTEQATKLVRDGIPPGEYGAALSLLLANSFEISAPVTKAKTSAWFRAFVIGALVYAVLLSFVPKNLLGIGAGERKIVLWRRYTRIVVITAPVWIFTSFLWPPLESIFRTWFSS